MKPSSTIIVGGGIVGISTAHYLARRGQAVTVLDDGDLTTSASTGNAGIVALGHPPLPRPGLVRHTLKWMLDPASPLYVPLRFDPGLALWMWQFSRACRRPHFERSVRLLAELGLAAGECFGTIVREESIDCSYQEQGWLEVYRSRSALETGREDADLLRRAGYTVSRLRRDELLHREPAFHESVIGAVRYANGGFLHPGRFLQQLARRAQDHGAIFHPRTTVERFVTDDSRVTGVETFGGRVFRADVVVLCAGSWTSGLARRLGVRVPMQPGKGYHVNLPPLDPPLRSASVLADRHIAATPMGDALRLAGTVELSGLNLRLHPRRVAMLTEGAVQFLPGIANVEPSPGWCGQRPCTADGLPVIGPAPRYGNLFIATGHAKMGLTLGPLTGRLLSEWILDGSPSMDLSAVSPARFA